MNCAVMLSSDVSFASESTLLCERWESTRISEESFVRRKVNQIIRQYSVFPILTYIN